MLRSFAALTATLVCCAFVGYAGASIVPIQAGQIQARVKVGDGIISPYKMLVVPGSGGHDLLVVTGQGESFGISMLHYVDSEKFRDQRPALRLCSNASSMTFSDNSTLIVACRSSQELFEININEWTISNRLSLNFAPIALATVSSGVVVVTSFNSGDVDLVKVDNRSLAVIRHIVLRKSSYMVVADSGRHLIYVVQPDFGVVALRADSLNIYQEYPSGGTPSFGAVMWKSKLLYTDRNGYLQFLDPDTGRIQHVDLAAMLGLDRSTLSLRGIDPTDIVLLGGGDVLVMSGRQNSVVLSLAGQFPFTVRAVAQIASGAYGVLDRQATTAYITAPTQNKIIHFRIEGNEQTANIKDAIETVVGRQLIYATSYSVDNQPAVAVIDSQNNLFVVSGTDALTADQISVRGVVPVGPLISGLHDSLLVIGNYRGVHAILQLAPDGSLLRHMDISTLWPVFSMSRMDNLVLLVDRLAGKLGILDLHTGKLSVYSAERTRPRAGLLTADGHVIVIHDTNPDIGVSLWSNGRMQTFTGFRRMHYPTDIATCDGGRTAIISFFGNDVIEIDTLTGEILNHVKLPDRQFTQLSTCCDGRIWAVSSNFDIADLLDLDNSLNLVGRIQISGLDLIFPYGGLTPDCETNSNARFWAVTDTDVDIFSLAPPTYHGDHIGACKIGGDPNAAERASTLCP